MKRIVAVITMLSLLLVAIPAVSEAEAPYGQRVADLALAQVGAPFVFGGANPEGFDASGLLLYVYGEFGASLPRTVAEQYAVGSAVTRANLRPGDIVLFASGSARWTAIFVGNNEVVWSSLSAGRVRKASLRDAAVSSNYQGARRLPHSAFASMGAMIAKDAAALVGARYEFGALGPLRFDASGLSQFVHTRWGINIPRTMAQQFAGGNTLHVSQLEPGDLLFFSFNGSSIGLVGVYVGNDEFVFSSQSAAQVIKRDIADYAASFMGAKRYHGAVPPYVPAPKPDLPTQIIETAKRYLGAPYVFGASGPESFDCSGFTRFVYGQHDISLPRTSVNQATAGVSATGMQKGDLLIFVDTYKPGISHVGIFIGDGQFIHATTSQGVSYANLSQSYWNTRLHSVRRVIP